MNGRIQPVDQQDQPGQQHGVENQRPNEGRHTHQQQNAMGDQHTDHARRVHQRFFGLLFGLPKPELQNQQQADRRKGQPLRGLPHGRASEHIARQRYRQINNVAAQNGGILFVPCALFVIFIGIQLEHVHQI